MAQPALDRFLVLMPSIRPIISRPLYEYVMNLCRMTDTRDMPNSEIHATRSCLTRLWSAFFVQYPVAIGPTWTQLPWPADADLEPGTGLQLVLDTVRFITPGNVLGWPSVALPTARTSADKSHTKCPESGCEQGKGELEARVVVLLQRACSSGGLTRASAIPRSR